MGIKTTSLSLNGAPAAPRGTLGSLDEVFRSLATLSLTCATFNTNYRLSTEIAIAKTLKTTKTDILPAQVTVTDCATNAPLTPTSLKIFFRLDFLARQSGFTNEVDAYNKITDMLTTAIATSTALADLISAEAIAVDPTLPPLGVASFEVSEPLEIEILASPEPSSQPTGIFIDEPNNKGEVIIFTSSLFVGILVVMLGSFFVERRAIRHWKKQSNKKHLSSSNGGDKGIEGDMLPYSQRTIDETTDLISSAVPCMKEDLAHRYTGPAPAPARGARGLESPVANHMVAVAPGGRDRRGSCVSFLCGWRQSNLWSRDLWRTHRWLGCLFFQPERSRLQGCVVRAGALIVVLFAACLIVFITAPTVKVELLRHAGRELPLALYIACFVSGLCVVSVLAERWLEPLVHYCFSAYLDVRVLFADKSSNKITPLEPPRSAVARINEMFENEAAFSAGGSISGYGYSDAYINNALDQRMTYDDYLRDGGEDGSDDPFEPDQHRRNAQQSAVDYSSKIQEDVAACRSLLLALAAPASIRSLDRLILEFDEVWGLDVDGKFSEAIDYGDDDSSVDSDEEGEGMLAMCWKYTTTTCRTTPVQQSSFQALVGDLFAINQQAADEQNRKYFTLGAGAGAGGEAEAAAVALKRRKRLVQLFLLDTLPPLSAAVVNSQILSSQDFIPPPTKPLNELLHLCLVGVCFFVLAACLASSLFLGTILNNHEQTLALLIFLVWLFVDAVLTSTLAMVVKHYALPLLARRDVKNAMYWLINAMDKGHHVSSSDHTDGAPLIHGEMTQSAARLSLDASKHFFVSTKLALLLDEPQLERDAILSFKTLWPKRSYGSNKDGSMYEYNQMVTVGYSKYPAQWLQNPFMRQNRGIVLGHVYHILSSLLLQYYHLPVPTQDVVTNLVCAGLAVALVLTHYWLALIRLELLTLPTGAALLCYLLARLVNEYFFHTTPGYKLRIIPWLLRAWCCCFRPTAYNKTSPIPINGNAGRQLQQGQHDFAPGSGNAPATGIYGTNNATGTGTNATNAANAANDGDKDVSQEVAERVAIRRAERDRLSALAPPLTEGSEEDSDGSGGGSGRGSGSGSDGRDERPRSAPSAEAAPLPAFARANSQPEQTGQGQGQEQGQGQGYGQEQGQGQGYGQGQGQEQGYGQGQGRRPSSAGSERERGTVPRGMFAPPPLSLSQGIGIEACATPSAAPALRSHTSGGKASHSHSQTHHSNSNQSQSQSRRASKAKAGQGQGQGRKQSGVASPPSSWFQQADFMLDPANRPATSPAPAPGSGSGSAPTPVGPLKPLVIKSVDQWLQMARQEDLRQALGSAQGSPRGSSAASSIPSSPVRAKTASSPMKRSPFISGILAGEEKEEPEGDEEEEMPSAARFLSQVASQNIMLGRGLSRGMSRGMSQGGGSGGGSGMGSGNGSGSSADFPSAPSSPAGRVGAGAGTGAGAGGRRVGKGSSSRGTPAPATISMVLSDSESDDDTNVRVRYGNRQPSREGER
jgi:hypothetical protein